MANRKVSLVLKRTSALTAQRFLTPGFWADSNHVFVWGLGGPGSSNNLSEMWGRSPSHFGKVFGAAGVAQTPNTTKLRSSPNPCIKNLSVQHGPNRKISLRFGRGPLMLPAQRFSTHGFWAGLVDFWGLSCPGGPTDSIPCREFIHRSVSGKSQRLPNDQ